MSIRTTNNQTAAGRPRRAEKASLRPRDGGKCDLLVTGTGSLAESILLSWPFSETARKPLRVTIVSRSETRSRELASLATLRAAASGGSLECVSAATSWDETDLAKVFSKYQPRLILHAASFQSPWPRSDADSEWRQAMRRFGYGLTTVLQSVLAFRVGRGAQASAPGAAFVNCCYPDAVNPLLALANIPITCGAGNVSIVAAVWRSRAHSSSPLRIIAHHAHLTQLVRPGPGGGVFPRVWIGPEECDRVSDVLKGVEFPSGKGMNHLTGAVTARLAQALLGTRPVRTHAPGPFGLVGGYPVLAGSGKVKLDLPEGLSRNDAIAFNAKAQLAEGISSIEERGLRYTKDLAAELLRHGSRFPTGFGPDEIEEAASDMLSVRRRLGGTEP